MKRYRGILLAMVIMSAVLAGCGEKQGSEAVATEPVVVEKSVSVEPVVEEESPEAVYPNYAFDEEFDIKKGETVTIGNEVSFYLEEYAYMEESASHRSQYIMFKGETKYPGFCFCYDNGEVWLEDEKYNPYKIECLAADEEKATFKVADDLPIPEALDLQVQTGESYTTTNMEYVEGERCILYLKEDITVPKDIIAQIEKVMAKVEEKTEYSFYSQSEFGDIHTRGVRELYYGEDPWPGVDEMHDKVAIYIVPGKNNEGEYLMSCAMNDLVVLSEEDYADETWTEVLAHELIHVIFLENGSELDSKMAEGFATYYTRQVMLDLKEYASNQLHENYYGEFNSSNAGKYKLDASTAEQLFKTDFLEDAHDMNNYRYGFYLLTYVTEKYGNKGVHDFMDCINQKSIDDYYGSLPSIDTQAEALKETFGEDFFTEFGSWYEKNLKRFS